MRALRCAAQVKSTLATERQSSQRLRAEAKRSRAELLTALDSSTALAQQNSALSSTVEEQREQIRQLQGTTAALTRQVEEAHLEARQQKAAFEKVGGCWWGGGAVGMGVG